MKYDTLLEQIDPELMGRLSTRRNALSAFGKLTAGLVTVPVALAALASNAFGKSLPAEVLGVLEFALLLEHLEDKFYDTALKTPGLIPDRDLTVIKQISAHEGAHVKLLATATVSPILTHKFDYTAQGRFPDVFSNYNTFLAVAQTFEDTGVRAYKGQATNLMGAGLILSLALRIHSVEARHAAEIRRMRGQKAWITGSSHGTLPAATQATYNGDGNTQQGSVNVASIGGVSDGAATEAFDEPLSKAQVMAIVKPFLAS